MSKSENENRTENEKMIAEMKKLREEGDPIWKIAKPFHKKEMKTNKS